MNSKSFLNSQTQEFLKQLRDVLPHLKDVYGVQELRIFGSRVRNDAHSGSDLDLLVTFDKRPLSLLQFVRLENYLSDLLGVDVDLVEIETLKPAIGQVILAEAVSI